MVVGKVSLGTNRVLVTGVMVGSAGGKQTLADLSPCWATPGRSGQPLVSKDQRRRDPNRREQGGASSLAYG